MFVSVGDGRDLADSAVLNRHQRSFLLATVRQTTPAGPLLRVYPVLFLPAFDPALVYAFASPTPPVLTFLLRRPG